MNNEKSFINAHRGKFIACIFLMLISLFLGGVAVAYRWEILWVLIFTLLFALFLVFAGYIYLTSQRDNAYDTLRKQKIIDEEDAKRRMAYFANMAHEIRTPINAILGYDELILREYSDPALRQYAYNIRSAGNTLLSLINDSLDYSRIEAGKMELFVSEYDIGVVIEDMMSLISPRAQAKGLEIKGFVNKDMPRLLLGDPDRLKQCIANLLTNSVKYTEEGEIDLSVDFEYIHEEDSAESVLSAGTEASEDDGTVASTAASGKNSSLLGEILLKVAVRDTGMGIRQEDLDRLYSPFERIGEEKNRGIEGSGLGISIVRQILDLMGAELKVESIYGEGSNFHFAIRQKVASLEPVGDFEQNYARTIADKNGFKISIRATDARVLVVDDAELNLAVMEGLLKGTGIEVDSALSATTGLEFARNNDYDLIFADIRMPGMEGGAMIKELRSNAPDSQESGVTGLLGGMIIHGRRPAQAATSVGRWVEDSGTAKARNAETPCIALTAGALKEIMGEYKGMGFDDYLLKPIAFKELENLLWRYLPSEKISRANTKGSRGEKKEDMPVLATPEKLQEAYGILAQRERTH